MIANSYLSFTWLEEEQECEKKSSLQRDNTSLQN